MMNKNRRSNVQIPGCLGRMVNLFDFGIVSNKNKFLTEKPHFDNGSTKKNQIEDEVDVRSDTFGVNGTPMKKLLAQEMSKEMEFNGSTNVVAKLMGLDSFPKTQPNAITHRSNTAKSRLKRSLSNGVESLSKKKIDIVREKFLEAKRLVTDDKLRHSKEFQEAMEVLSSNKELFIEFLQESNNLFSLHLHSFQSTAPETPEKSKHITILKPSKNIDSSRDEIKSEKGLHSTKQSSRIVVLKPNSSSSCPMDDYEERKFRTRRLKREMLKEETLHSSVNSNGEDDSSENNYADSEIMSPVSWDYIKKYDSPFSSSSPFSRPPGSPESSSSVCREAKKRLSERWALIATSSENLKSSNSTLGDMLALKELETEEEEEASDGNGNVSHFKSLTRSKSLPEWSINLACQSPDTKSKDPEMLTKSKSLKWSLKGKVSNFLFSRNKKVTKERSHQEPQVVYPEILNYRCDESDSARSMCFQEEDLSIAKPNEWHDEPSSVSVLETSFDEDDRIFFNSSTSNRSSHEPEMMSMKSNLLGKSPPIGSIGRSFSFDNSTIARCYSSKRSTTSTRDEEQDLRLLINTLLLAANLDEESLPSSISDNLLSKLYSAESPLDPSLRNIYTDSTEQSRLGSNMKKLVFDLVNTLILELIPSYLKPRSRMILYGKTLQSYVMNRMQECLTGDGRVEDRWWDEDGDLSSLVVNKVVRIEVASEVWSPERLRMEMDSMGEELELKLLEELVEETLMDFSEQSKLLISSIC